MPGSTTELNLQTAVDSDDNADYLTVSLANSLRTVDALFNNTSGHTHAGAHQGGPLGAGSIPTGTITSAMIADGTIQTADIAANAVTLGNITTSDGSTYTRTVVSSPTTLPGVGAYSATFTGGMVLVLGQVIWQHTVVGGAVTFGFAIDGGTPNQIYQSQAHAANAWHTATFIWVYPSSISAGSHSLALTWDNLTAGTLTRGPWYSQLVVVEFKR